MANDAYLPDPDDERSDEEYAMYQYEQYMAEQKASDAADMRRQLLKDDQMIEQLEKAA